MSVCIPTKESQRAAVLHSEHVGACTDVSLVFMSDKEQTLPTRGHQRTFITAELRGGKCRFMQEVETLISLALLLFFFLPYYTQNNFCASNTRGFNVGASYI